LEKVIGGTNKKSREKFNISDLAGHRTINDRDRSKTSKNGVALTAELFSPPESQK